MYQNRAENNNQLKIDTNAELKSSLNDNAENQYNWTRIKTKK